MGEYDASLMMVNLNLKDAVTLSDTVTVSYRF